MKAVLLLLALIALAASFHVSAHSCPHDKEVQCIDDINKAYAICEKAAHEKGKDVPVDLDCMKYFATMGEDCWECICWVAELNNVHIAGC